MRLASAAAILFMIFPVIAQAREKIEVSQASGNIGNNVTVTGEVKKAYCKPNACYLDFHEKPESKHKFTAIIYVFDLGEFPPDPDQYYQGKRLEIDGTIRDHNGIPSIILKSQSQIRTPEKTD